MIRRRTSGSLLPVLFLAACIGLGWVIYQELRAFAAPEMRSPATRAATADVPALESRPNFRMPPEQRFAAILERPIFSPGRRLPEEEAETEAVVDSVLGLKIIGIVIAGDAPLVLAAPESGGDPVRLHVGDRHAGWTLGEITAEEVIFRRDDEERRLQLKFELAPARKPVQPTRRDNRAQRRQGDRTAPTLADQVRRRQEAARAKKRTSGAAAGKNNQ